MGWPEHDWSAGGLRPARRRAMLTALDPKELRELVTGDAREVEERVRGLLRMFGLGMEDYTRKDVATLAEEARALHAQQAVDVEGLAVASPRTGSDALAHFDYTAVPRKHISRRTEFRERGEVTSRCVGVLTTRIGHTECILLAEGILLTSALFLAHVAQARSAVVEFYGYKGAPIPPLTFRLDAKRLLAVGMGAGGYFACDFVELVDSKTAVVRVLSHDAMRVRRAKEYFPAGVYVGGDLPVGTIVNLTASESVLLEVVSEDVAAGTLTLTAVHGTHGMTEMPAHAYGIVHRHGDEEAYTLVALEAPTRQTRQTLTSTQQVYLDKLLEGGIPLSAAPGIAERTAAATPPRYNPAAYNDTPPAALMVTAAHITPGEGVACKIATAAFDDYFIPFPLPGLLFTLEWDVVGFVTYMTKTFVGFAEMLYDMRVRGFIDVVNNRIVQGDGLLAGGMERERERDRGRAAGVGYDSSVPTPTSTSRGTPPPSLRDRRKIEAERLEWGEKGLDLMVQGGPGAAADAPGDNMLDLPCIGMLDDDDDGPLPLTLPPFSVLLLDKMDEIDLAASREATVTIAVDPPGYRLLNNTSTMLRGEAVFYHLRIFPPPREPFRLAATVAIEFTGALRYPLQKRHVMPKYTAVAAPPLFSRCIRVQMDTSMAALSHENPAAAPAHTKDATVPEQPQPQPQERQHSVARTPPADTEHRVQSPGAAAHPVPTPPRSDAPDTAPPRARTRLSLHRRLGGAQAVAQIIHSVIARITNDVRLAAAIFPEGVTAAAKDALVTFFTARAGSDGGDTAPLPPLPYDTRATTENWARLAACVENALQTLCVGRREQVDVMKLLTALRDEHLVVRAAARRRRALAARRKTYPHNLYSSSTPPPPRTELTRMRSQPTMYPTSLFASTKSAPGSRARTPEFLDASRVGHRRYKSVTFNV